MVAEAKKLIVLVSSVLTWTGIIIIGMVSLKLLAGLALYAIGDELIKKANKL